MMDSGNLRLRARHPQSHQGVCADAIATLESIPREALDALSLESQKRADRAIRNGYFAKSLVPVHHEDGTLALDREEYPRPQTTREGLAALKPAFQAMADAADRRGRHHLSSADHAKVSGPQHRVRAPRGLVVRRGRWRGGAAARLAGLRQAQRAQAPREGVAMANMGGSPTLMLNAPVPAARKALAKAGLTLDDIDLFEINEAFAVVAEKFIRDLALDREKVNVNGGAIALGHPIGATGSILIGTLLDELERRDLKRGLVTMCAAGGMAPAVIVERV